MLRLCKAFRQRLCTLVCRLQHHAQHRHCQTLLPRPLPTSCGPLQSLHTALAHSCLTLCPRMYSVAWTTSAPSTLLSHCGRLESWRHRLVLSYCRSANSTCSHKDFQLSILVLLHLSSLVLLHLSSYLHCLLYIAAWGLYSICCDARPVFICHHWKVYLLYCRLQLTTWSSALASTILRMCATFCGHMPLWATTLVDHLWTLLPIMLSMRLR